MLRFLFLLSFAGVALCAKEPLEIKTNTTEPPTTSTIVKSTIGTTGTKATTSVKIDTTTAVVASTTANGTEENSVRNGGKGGKNKEKEVAAMTGWYIWALLWGFMVGCVTGGLISALILFLCRRTFYSSYYRGMFNRYQCDVDDTEAEEKMDADKKGSDSMMLTMVDEPKRTKTTHTPTSAETTTMTRTAGSVTESLATTPANEEEPKKNKSTTLDSRLQSGDSR